jgi:hypothetical protein
MAVVTKTGSCRVMPDDTILLEQVQTCAKHSNRPVRPLHLQTLLQAPRIADKFGFVRIPDLTELIRELAVEIPVRAEWRVRDLAQSPVVFRFGPLDSGRAKTITERFHYLRSPRRDGHAYGLHADDGSPVAICVISPLDVQHVQHLLSFQGRSPQHARTLSRVFVFEGAPRNCISYLLSRCAVEERQRGITDLVTYVNPNMGFTGISYRASSWTLLGTEPGTTYRYLDRRYITDRELEAKFQKHTDSVYHQMLGERFAVSVMPLQPLLIYHSVLG